VSAFAAIIELWIFHDRRAGASTNGSAGRHVFFGVGAGVASTVYGTIVVMATLTAAYASQKQPWKLAGIVASASVVLWVAHLYAHGLSESIVRNGG
jgi:hypothetical protein